ncbi:MAG TPA: PASTA domain-containing protein, partial [Bacteroidia bacterium]
IKKGSVIDLVVGKGSSGGEQVTVINVTGITYCQAKSKLLSNGLSIGALILDGALKDTCNAFVYKQSPGGGSDNMVNIGASVDLYITMDKSKLNANKDEDNE